MNKLIYRFAAAYAGLALIVILSGFAAYKAYTIKSVPHPATVVHTQDLGQSNVVRIAEQSIETQAAQAGLVIKSFKVVSVSLGKTQAKVVLTVVAVDATGQKASLKLSVSLSKGLYSVSDIQRVG